MKRSLFLVVPLLVACVTLATIEAVSKAKSAARLRASIAKSKGGVPTDPHAVAEAAARSKILVFRDRPSWDRKPDFEDVLTDLHFKFDVESSAEMAGADLSPYEMIIIPGAQEGVFYHAFDQNPARFERYVANGGTLVLELNGAEMKVITLPGGVRMVRSYARDNQLILPEHPILLPLGGKPIHANFASHGYLAGLPKDTLILATESVRGWPLTNRPTFIEYAYGSGRIIAACECFHDRDGSGRGPMMPTLIEYAAVKKWFTPGKSP